MHIPVSIFIQHLPLTLVFIQRPISNPFELLICAGKSAVTAATASLSSAHQAGYKRHSSNPAFISDHIHSAKSTALHCTNSQATTLYDQATSATAALRPANQRGRATSANSYFYRRTQWHITGKTDQLNGRKSLSIAEKWNSVEEWIALLRASNLRAFYIASQLFLYNLYIQYIQFNILLQFNDIPHPNKPIASIAKIIPKAS
jgi:hypothetical protein